MLRTALFLIVGSSAVLVLCLPPQTSTTTPKSNARLCPNGKIYHNQTQRCYNVGERGPCGKFMTFGFAKSESTEYGQCSCRKFEDTGCAARPLVYWPEKNSCYPLFDKGPCKSQEWLTVNENGIPTCQKNNCENFSLFADEDDEDEEEDAAETAPPKIVNFSYKGKCYKSETQGFCNETEKVYFVEGSFLPQCYNDQDHPVCVKTVLFSLSNIPTGDCAEGKRISNGVCVEAVDFV